MTDKETYEMVAATRALDTAEENQRANPTDVQALAALMLALVRFEKAHGLLPTVWEELAALFQ
jgi:hypothetical protein